MLNEKKQKQCDPYFRLIDTLFQLSRSVLLEKEKTTDCHQHLPTPTLLIATAQNYYVDVAYPVHKFFLFPGTLTRT